MTDREPLKVSESIQHSLANRETVAPSGLEDSTPTGSGPFAALPSQFGRYRVTKLLGRGAMGTVYLAHDPDLGKDVALKVPRFSGDEDPVLLERFRREARAAGDLNHANICGVYEVGQIGTTHFIAMEYIDGRPLSDYISPDLPCRKIAILVRRLALALAQAHDRGIVHRDLKPANIMVNLQGEPVIMDFGLACRLDPVNDVRTTQSGMIVGSPAYMSPEQARADRDSIGPRTDIYGLGTLFFELLTGSLPFRGPMLSVLGQLATQPPPKPSSLRADVDPRLEALCLKMLEKQPQNRPASMADVAQSLTEWLKPATTKSEPAIALVEEPVALVPTKPAAPRADKVDGLEAHKQRVTDLLEKRQYGPAIELLEKINNLRDAKFEKLVAWAKPKLKEARATEQKLKEASTPICALAQQDLKRHDYASAVQNLEQVPPAYRSIELRDLLQQTTDLRDECDHLQRDIEDAIRTGDADTLPALIKRLLKLKPNNKAIKQLAADLKQHGAKKVIAQRKGQRLIVTNERLFEPQQIAAYVLGIAALFATVYFAVVVYVQTPHGTLVVDVQGEGLQAIVQDGHVVIRDGKQEFRVKTTDKKTLTVEHRGSMITGSSREITLKRGEKRTVTIKLVDGKVQLTENAETFTFPVIRDTAPPSDPLPQTITSPSTGMKLTLIPAGTFMMGSPISEVGRWDHEGPQHTVSISQPFHLGVFEVTQYEYEKVMGVNPSAFSMSGSSSGKVTGQDTSKFPVDSVSWYDAIEFCNNLSTKDNLAAYYSLTNVERDGDSIKAAKVSVLGGRGYRLPTEAEWEFACRGHTTTPFHFGITNNGTDANVMGSAPYGTTIRGPNLVRTTTVGTYKGNAFGLFDMHGNVNEWCEDVYDAAAYSTRSGTTIDPLVTSGSELGVLRSAAWATVSSLTRSAFRYQFTRGVPSDNVGLRVVLPSDGKGTRSTTLNGLRGRGPAINASELLGNWPKDAPRQAVAPFGAAQARQHQDEWAKQLGVPVEYTNSIGMKFVFIPPGEFTMGSTAAEIDAALMDAYPDATHWHDCIRSEAPQHKVILTQPIYLGIHEVKQAEYEKVMGTNPAHFAPNGPGKEAVAGMDTSNHPIEIVSWNDAVAFCVKLSQQEKLKPAALREDVAIMPPEVTGYRLPTEAEWEFACRAGTTTNFWIGDKDEDLRQAGWFGENAGDRTHAVGELKANPFGLFDIHGNVWEWVLDKWEPDFYREFSKTPAINPINPSSSESERIIRGGRWYHSGSYCRSSFRFSVAPTDRFEDLGFRVSLPVATVKAAIASRKP